MAKMIGMIGMKASIKYVERWKDRHGKIRLYYRKRPNPRIPLRDPVGSPEFWEDYNNAKNGIDRKPSVQNRAKPDSMRWLVEQYYMSPSFKNMSPGYQKTRRGILEKFCEEHGAKRYAQLHPRHVIRIRNSMADRPGAANNLLKALSQVFKNAVELGLVDGNPLRDVSKLEPKNKDGFHAWTPDEIKQFEECHPPGTKAHLAMTLLLCTGQRRSDVVKLGRQHMKDGWITIKQQKTNTELKIPVLQKLRSALEAADTGNLTFLVTEYGKPFTANGFGNWFRDRCDEAGLRHCSAHGLRKAAAASLAQAGCSVHEIMSITGHKSVSEVQRYTKTAQQKQLAESARNRLEGL